MRVAVAGLGRAGATIAAGVAASPVLRLEAAWCRTNARALDVRRWFEEERLDSRPIVLGEAPPLRLRAADVVLLCVPDRSVSQVAEDALAFGAISAGQVWLHLSGSSGTDAFGPEALARFRDLEVEPGALHPMCALPEPTGNEGSTPGSPSWPLAGALMAVAGTRRAIETAWSVAQSLGGEPIEVPAARRPLYHAAAALASNDVLALCAVAIDALILAGLPEDAARRGVAHLATTAARPLHGRSLPEVATGPVIRRDWATVAGHFNALESTGEIAPEALGIHALLTAALGRRLHGDGRLALPEASELAAILANHLPAPPRHGR